MPLPAETLCSRCSIRPATNHVCFGGSGKSLDLCDECLPLESPSTAGFIGEARNARCEYCGGSPCCGGTDLFDLSLGPPAKIRWKCLSCSSEFNTFVLAAISKISRDLPHEIQAAEIRSISEEVELHMKAFVRQRDN